MTLDYVLRQGRLADIAEDRFWSQANVVIVIADSLRQSARPEAQDRHQPTGSHDAG